MTQAKDITNFIKDEIITNKQLDAFNVWHNKNTKSSQFLYQSDSKIANTDETKVRILELKICTEYTNKLRELVQPGINALNYINDVLLPRIEKGDKSKEDNEKRIFEEHDNNHDNILNQIHAEKDAKVNLLQSNLKLVNEAASALIHQYESKVREHSRYELNNKVPIWLGWIVIFVLAIAEGPLNAQVFEFFKLGSKETLITASLVIIIFPLLAHFTGVGLHKDTRGKINYKTVISLMFIILIFCFAINAFRVDYLETREHLGEVDYVKPSAISLMVTTQFAFAFILNISLFVGGILISYFMHDTDADFEKTVKNYRSNYPKLQKNAIELEKQITFIKAKSQKAIDAFNKNKQLEERKISEELQKGEDSNNSLKAQFDCIVLYLQHVEEHVNDKYKIALLNYRHNFQLSHPNVPLPSNWREQPEDLPKLFSDLDINEIKEQKNSNS